ncbi:MULTISPECIES: nuclear transport factor 2 family protein [unclassified Thioalkalivibrio]|uniref:YybH family protein n=1 Tax=unclassified Thioalkalivibrio TaxID=2621013 RepID=UPI00038046D7|nr:MULTISPECIES: nuclear transport factor 2 family protein [unclassified Thioalkalivibrio]
MSTFPSPESVETAFYEAFQAGDPQRMRAVWHDSAECVCIHPGGERLQGTDIILESWDDILPGMRGVIIHRTQCTVIHGDDLALHVLRENLYVHGERRGVMLATNGYREDGDSWRMVLHHASPDPEPTAEWPSGGMH